MNGAMVVVIKFAQKKLEKIVACKIKCCSNDGGLEKYLTFSGKEEKNKIPTRQPVKQCYVLKLATDKYLDYVSQIWMSQGKKKKRNELAEKMFSLVSKEN